MKILVVDPTSSGKDLVGALRTRPDVQVDEHYQDHPFEVGSYPTDDRPERALLNRATTGGYDAVVAGSESGVTAADWLAHWMGLPSNDPELLWHRRNKKGMVDAAARAGLSTPKTWTVSSFSDLAAITDQLTELRHGVVIKPLGSGGSDSCFICRTPAEVASAVGRILGSTNLFGALNHEVLVQERIGGQQYFVNAVSAAGRHVITEMFHYGISEDAGVPHIYSAQTIAPSNPLFTSGTEYVLTLLDVLGVQFGASHTEIRYDNGVWTLIEYNGRCMGPSVPSSVYLAGRGFSQVTVLADCLLAGIDAAQHGVEAGFPDHCIGWHMPTPQRSGQLHRTDWSPLENLESFVGAFNEPAPGTVVDLGNRVTTASAGLLFFSHQEAAVVTGDIDQSVSLERAGKFFVFT